MNQEITTQETVIEEEIELEQVIASSEQEESDEDRNVYLEFFRH